MFGSPLGGAAVPTTPRSCGAAGFLLRSPHAHAALIRELGATPIDYQREDFTRTLPGGFDVVLDGVGVGAGAYRGSFLALKPGGVLCAYGYTAGVQARRRFEAGGLEGKLVLCPDLPPRHDAVRH